MKVVFDPEAVLELREAVAFYESSQLGLGRAFLDAVETGVSEVVKHPRLWRRVWGRFRRYLIPRFPYGIIYTAHEDVLYVAAIMHLRRKPGYWIGRTRRRRI